MNYFDVDILIDNNYDNMKRLSKYLDKENHNQELMDDHIKILLNYIKNKKDNEKLKKQILKLSTHK